MQGTLTHDGADDTLTLQFSSGSLQLKPIGYVRVDVLLPGTPSPSPTPTTASPSPTTDRLALADHDRRPTTSPSPSVDQQVQDNIAKLQVGIVAWAADNNNLYPPPQDVVQGGGIAQYVRPVADQPVHRPAHDAGHLTRQLRVRAAQRRAGVQAHRLPEQRPDVLGAVSRRREPQARALRRSSSRGRPPSRRAASRLGR